MIRGNEIRHGNFIEFEGETCDLYFDWHGNMCINRGLFMTKADKDSLIKVNSIPLDETWLIKFGFRQLDKYTFVKGNFFVYKRKRGFITGSKKREIKLNTVHKLQNVYYFSTDYELFI